MLGNYSSIDDKSFNQSTWEGIRRWARDNHLPEKNYVYQPSQVSLEASVLNLANLADRHPDLVIATGFSFAESINVVARKYPKQKFLLIDAVSNVVGNVASATFANHEGAFLVGLAAALKARDIKCNKLGFIGGFDHVVIREFEAGFEAGVRAVDPALKVFREYVGDFSNPPKGQRFAGNMYDFGVCGIFSVAGGTGIGVIKEAKARALKGGKAFVVGVDRDQYEDGIYDGKNSVILTSMLKKVDVAVYDVLSRVANGDFQGGNIVYSLKDNGVGLPENNPNLKTEWSRIIHAWEREIINGDVVVPGVPERVIKQVGSTGS